MKPRGRRRRRGGRELRPGCPGGTRRGWSAGPAGGASVGPRVTHFRPAASGLTGPDLAPNNNKTGARAAAPRLQSPPSCHLPPAAARPRLALAGRPAGSPPPPAPRSRGPRPRPSANSSRRARAASRDPLAAAAQSSRKGAVAAEDARPDSAAGGGGPRDRLRYLPGGRPEPGLSPAREAGPRRRGLVACQLWGRGGDGAAARAGAPPPLPSSLLTALSLSPPGPLRSPESGGA